MPFWPKRKKYSYLNQNEPPGVAPRLISVDCYDTEGWTNTLSSVAFFGAAAAAVCGIAGLTMLFSAMTAAYAQYAFLVATMGTVTGVVAFGLTISTNYIFPYRTVITEPVAEKRPRP